MRIALIAASSFLLLGACSKSDVRLKVLMGATTVVASGAAPLTDSIIVIAGKSIRSLGTSKDVPVPQNSDRTDLTGRWIIPASGGGIGVEEPANLLILSQPPAGVVPARPSDVEARMVGGEWQAGK